MAGSMLEVRHLRLVRAIADEGGPTRAAARLHLTQSAVSHQLADLEGRLGIRLFSRVRRKLSPTPAGARLLDASRRLLADLDQLERALHYAGAEKREVLRLAVESFTTYHWLPPVVAALTREHPQVDVRIVVEAHRAPVAALLRGTVDLAIVSSAVRDRALVSAPLGDDEWTVILAPSHPLARRPYISAAELGEQTLFAHDAPRGDVERLRDIAAAERAPLPRVTKVPLTEALVDLVRAGLGVGLVSRWAVAPFAARGDVVMRPFTRTGLPERWARCTGATPVTACRCPASSSSCRRRAHAGRTPEGLQIGRAR